VQSVRVRLDFAKTVYESTVERYRDAWSGTIAALADPSLSPRYGGFRLRAQVGLIPLGRDPESGLFEFAHLQTGEPPERGSGGKLRLAEESGLVFILLPGGTFDMGAVPPSEDRPAGSPNVDPGAMPPERPVHAVTVRPFFLSKYEMTQGQWVRFTGRNPSAIPAEDYMDGKTTYLHPVEHISWEEGVKALRHLGLRLPSESEWEYAARGGTSTVWWTGDDDRSLGGEAPGSLAGNLHDLTAKKRRVAIDLKFEEWLDDGYSRHAPVGLYRPNPFGFHDVCGNVWELCQDAGHGSYEGAPADGSAWEEVDSRVRIVRGGGYDGPALQCRSAFRAGCLRDYRASAYGIRPALSIEE
jgi:formylglycine-generating enzyme required for sulfatase activity